MQVYHAHHGCDGLRGSRHVICGTYARFAVVEGKSPCGLCYGKLGKPQPPGGGGARADHAKGAAVRQQARPLWSSLRSELVVTLDSVDW